MKKSSVRTFESGRDYAGNRDDHICIKHIQSVFIEKIQTQELGGCNKIHVHVLHICAFKNDQRRSVTNLHCNVNTLYT